MAEQTIQYRTNGDPDVALRGIGMTINQFVEGGVFQFKSAGAGYAEKIYDTAEALNAVLAPLYHVDIAEGYLSEAGIVSLLDEMADRQDRMMPEYEGWIAGDRARLAATISEEFAETETRKRWGKNHGKWATSEQIRAGDVDMKVRSMQTKQILTPVAVKALIAAHRGVKGEGGARG